MVLDRRSLRRVSESVAYTEQQQRSTKTGTKLPRGTSTQAQTVRKGVILTNPIDAPNWTGKIAIYKDGVPTGEELDIEGSWLNGGDKFSVGVRVVVAFFADENVWTIIAADCET